MESPDRWLYEYATIRYVPRIDREEFVNIGLLMLCKRRKWMKGRVEINEDRVKALFPDADIKKLQCQCSLFERNDVPGKDLPIEEKYRWLTAVKSAVLQTSPSHPGLVPMPDKENPASIYSDNDAGDMIEIYNKTDEDSVEAEILLEKEFDRLFSELVSV